MGRKRRTRKREPLYFYPAYLKAGQVVEASQMTLLLEVVSDNTKGGLV